LLRNLKLYSLLETLLGRRLLLRTGRFLYMGARRELLNSPEVNGEYTLVCAMAGWMAQTGGPHVCFDVGANLGDWTAELLRNTETDDLTVYPFEPAPAQYTAITGRFADQIAAKKIVPQQLALAAEPGTAQFVVTGANSGNSAIATSDAVIKGQSITVTLATIDQFCADHRLDRLAFVKVDTEGNDFNVIAGAAAMLAGGRIGLLQFEYNWRWVSFGHTLRKAFKAIEGQDYAVAQITEAGLEVHDEWHPELERFFETNFALVRHDMLAQLPHRRVRYDDANTLVAV
jgi:FkbM family methyltransferase